MKRPVFEDSDLLVFNKPSGMASAPIRDGETHTGVAIAIAYFPKLIQVQGHKPLEFGLLHRLDNSTSGLLVFAKTQAEFNRLREIWKKREITKIYRAVIQPTSEFSKKLEQVKKFPLRIDDYLAHSARSSKKMISISRQSLGLSQKENKSLQICQPWPEASNSPLFNKIPKKISNQIRGKLLEAYTQILSIHASLNARAKKDRTGIYLPSNDPLFDLTILIETGVMHQIRCHLAAQGWPIVGDSLYRGNPSTRTWLHAWQLKIPLKNGTILSLEAPLPENWLVDLSF